LLLDHARDLTYFVKDLAGRYVSVNKTLVQRTGKRIKSELVGRTAKEVYSQPHGDHFWRQDLEVIEAGRPLIDELEQHPYPRRVNGWCLTTKIPLLNKEGAVIGLTGMSRDLQAADQKPDVYESVALVIDRVKARISQPASTEELAEFADLSPWRLDQRIRDLFGLTTGQLVLQLRMEAAVKQLLTTSAPIIDIAISVGYADQSAFSRQFRKTFGLPPSQYRRAQASTESDPMDDQ
jgi:AraC-like DNA-binding protein